MKLGIQLIIIALLGYTLSGCIAAAIGAGAAGGAYIEKNYDVSLKVKKKTANKDNKE